MEVKVINSRTIIEEFVREQRAQTVQLYAGSKQEALTAQNSQEIGRARLVTAKSTDWRHSAGHEKLWHDFKKLQKKAQNEMAANAAQAPSAATLEALVGLYLVDMTRRYMEQGDLTSRIAIESTNADFPESLTLRDIYEYIAHFKAIRGTGDAVPLVEQALGTTESISMAIYAAGWSTSLRNLLFNSLHSLQKVNDAVAKADVDLRNSRVIGPIIDATYVASQKVSAVADTSFTFDENMYNFLRWGVKKLLKLLDNKTSRQISSSNGISILCNSQNQWDIERVIRGQLDINGAAGTRGNNRQALPINELIVYDQGGTNGMTWGQEDISYPGVTAGKCYLFIPRAYAWVFNKRPLTLETGMGSVLTLSQEDRAWYRVQTEFFKDFLGSSYSSHPSGHEAGYGAVVEVNLPTEDT